MATNVVINVATTVLPTKNAATNAKLAKKKHAAKKTKKTVARTPQQQVEKKKNAVKKILLNIKITNHENKNS